MKLPEGMLRAAVLNILRIPYPSRRGDYMADGKGKAEEGVQGWQVDYRRRHFPNVQGGKITSTVERIIYWKTFGPV